MTATSTVEKLKVRDLTIRYGDTVALNGASFEPKCDEPPACRNAHSRNPGSGNLAATCRCSGDGIGDLATLEIVDYVRIPKDLPAGEYVVGWRWVSPPHPLSLLACAAR